MRLVWLTAWAAGCFTPHQLSLNSALPDRSPLGNAPQCMLEVAPVVDDRPRFEQRGHRGEFVRLSYLLPFVFVTGWQSAGPRYAPPRQVTRELHTHLSRLVSTTLNQSEVCSGSDGPTVRIEPRVTHLYGMSYVRDGGTFIVIPIDEGVDISFWHSARQDMWPTVQVDLTLEVFLDGRSIGSDTVRERFLFDPGQHLPLWMQVEGAETAVTVALDRAIPTAVSRALSRAPLAVDRRLAEHLPRRLDHSRFVALRLTDRYDFVERMVIETATGRILHDAVERRVHPITSRPGEWVVAPLAADGRHLGRKAYEALLTELRDRGYRVEWGQNLSAAQFLGGGPDPGAPPLAIPAGPGGTP